MNLFYRGPLADLILIWLLEFRALIMITIRKSFKLLKLRKIVIMKVENLTFIRRSISAPPSWYVAAHGIIEKILQIQISSQK